jgi:hypothetical protein
VICQTGHSRSAFERYSQNVQWNLPLANKPFRYRWSGKAGNVHLLVVCGRLKSSRPSRHYCRPGLAFLKSRVARRETE